MAPPTDAELAGAPTYKSHQPDNGNNSQERQSHQNGELPDLASLYAAGDGSEVVPAANILMSIFGESQQILSNQNSASSSHPNQASAPKQARTSGLHDVDDDQETESDNNLEDDRMIHAAHKVIHKPTRPNSSLRTERPLHGYGASDRHGYDPSFEDILLDTPAREPPPKSQPQEANPNKKGARKVGGKQTTKPKSRKPRNRKASDKDPNTDGLWKPRAKASVATENESSEPLATKTRASKRLAAMSSLKPAVQPAKKPKTEKESSTDAVVRQTTPSSSGLSSPPDSPLTPEFMKLAHKLQSNPPTRPMVSTSPLPDVQLPNVQVPNVQVPNVHIPNVRVPNVHVPSVQVPSVHVPNVHVPSVQVPNVHVPSVQVPSVHVPNAQLPNARASNPPWTVTQPRRWAVNVPRPDAQFAATQTLRFAPNVPFPTGRGPFTQRHGFAPNVPAATETHRFGPNVPLSNAQGPFTQPRGFAPNVPRPDAQFAATQPHRFAPNVPLPNAQGAVTQSHGFAANVPRPDTQFAATQPHRFAPNVPLPNAQGAATQPARSAPFVSPYPSPYPPSVRRDIAMENLWNLHVATAFSRSHIRTPSTNRYGFEAKDENEPPYVSPYGAVPQPRDPTNVTHTPKEAEPTAQSAVPQSPRLAPYVSLVWPGPQDQNTPIKTESPTDRVLGNVGADSETFTNDPEGSRVVIKQEK